jgi:glycine oxidase
VKSWDVIIMGAGIIGLSLALALRKQGLRVLMVERGEPGREASSAAAGMLAGSGTENPPELRALAAASAKMYPEFVHELEDESGIEVDLREQGTIVISSGNFSSPSADSVFSGNVSSGIVSSEITSDRVSRGHEFAGLEFGGHELPGDELSKDEFSGYQRLSEQQLKELEPALARERRQRPEMQAALVVERSVDPRALVRAAGKAAQHRGVEITSGNEVRKLLVEHGRAIGIEAVHGKYRAPRIVNCCGAWTGTWAGTGAGTGNLPVRPVKGQMLAVVGGPAIGHVIRSDDIYLVPRSDGRIVIGSTLEDAGFNKQTEAGTIQKMFHAAIELAPPLAQARMHEDWAGLRPKTPDGMPILGETSIPGYLVAAGHYRDGILLAPVTAEIMRDVIGGKSPAFDLAAFSASRFAS